MRSAGVLAIWLGVTACATPISPAVHASRSEPIAREGARVCERSHAVRIGPRIPAAHRGWFGRWTRRRASPRGTPYVRAILVQPAFLERDLSGVVADTATETETTAELDWAFTPRLALSVVVPTTNREASGIGDVALSVRALLCESSSFLLAASVGLSWPTGDDDFGLEYRDGMAGAHAHAWLDLGSWVTLQGQAGLRLPVDSVELVWRAALLRSFPARPLFGIAPPGVPHVFTIAAEVAGGTNLGDADTTGEWLLGCSYPLTHTFDVRAAYFELFDGVEGWRAGFTFRF